MRSGLIVDWMQFEHAVTSMSFSFDGCFLATTHRDTVGIHIWTNKHHFGGAFLKAVGTAPVLMDRRHDGEEEEERRRLEAMEETVAAALQRRTAWRSEEDADSLSEADLEDILDLEAQSESEDEDAWAGADALDLPDIASLHLDGDRPLITMSATPKAVWKNLVCGCLAAALLALHVCWH